MALRGNACLLKTNDEYDFKFGNVFQVIKFINLVNLCAVGQHFQARGHLLWSFIIGIYTLDSVNQKAGMRGGGDGLGGKLILRAWENHPFLGLAWTWENIFVMIWWFLVW
jgi:hypothetical protein